MRIFICSRGVPSPEYPLNGIFELDQAKALQKEGVNVVLIVLDFRSIFRRRRWGFYAGICEGITCFHISFPLGNLEIPLFNFLARKLTRFGAKLIKKRHGLPTIIHSHFLPISRLSVELKRAWEVPLVMTEHSSLINQATISSSIKKMGMETYPHADKLIAVSEALRGRILGHFGSNALVVNNIINSQIFKFNPLKENLDRSDFVFVSVGTLIYNKGFDLLIEAFAKAALPKNVKLTIVGSGEFEDDLIKLVEKYSLSDVVDFKGYQSREDISRLYLNADAFILPSRGETFGVVYVEALMSGLPAIATRCGGPEEFIDDTNGILVSPEKIDELSAAISFMVKNINKFDRNLISQNTMVKFSPHTIASRLLRVYSQIQTKSKY